MMLRSFVLTAVTAISAVALTACGVAPGDESPADEVGTSEERLVIQPPPVLVDFDRDPSNAALANGAVVDTAYASLGVTFTCVSCASGHAYARSPGRAENGVSVFPSPYYSAYDARYGAVRADFASPRASVTIDARSVLPPEFAGTPVARPWIEAYDSTNAMVARAYYPAFGDPAFGTWQTLRVDAPAGKSIQYVRFSSQNFSTSPAVYAQFDNLTFNSDPIYIVDRLIPVEKPVILRPARPVPCGLTTLNPC